MANTPAAGSDAAILMTETEMEETLTRLAKELCQRYTGAGEVALIGIQRRGVFIARRLAKLMADLKGAKEKGVLQGVLDINLYRDDWTSSKTRAVIGASSIDFDINGRAVVLVDDVLYTGRTIRAALEALADFGRPQKVELLALVDRGHRELPIHADYVGKTIQTSREDHVDVLMKELDGTDQVLIRRI